MAKPYPKPAPKPKAKKYNGLKTTPADKWFSLCIRERSDWTCEYCGTHYEPDYSLSTGLPKNQGLDCSHFYGRGLNHWSTRTNPDNANAHCYYCHRVLGTDHDTFVTWKKKQLGDERYEILREISMDAMRGKAERQGHNSGEAEKHYEAEFRRMRLLRDRGATGRIEFVGWL